MLTPPPQVLGPSGHLVLSTCVACKERSRQYADPHSIMGAAGLSVLPKHVGRAIPQGLEDAKEAGRDVDEQFMAMAAQQQDDITWQEAQDARLEAERERALEELEDDDFDG